MKSCHHCKSFGTQLETSRETGFYYCSLACASRAKTETLSSLIHFSDMFDIDGERNCICGRKLPDNPITFPASTRRSVPICTWNCHLLWTLLEDPSSFDNLGNLVNEHEEKTEQGGNLYTANDSEDDEKNEGMPVFWSSSYNFMNFDGTSRPIPFSIPMYIKPKRTP